MTLLSVTPAHKLKAVPPQHQWLIHGLWAKEAVGIIGGEPKSYKSFLALSIAVAVTSGKPCLQSFAVKQTGRVLLYAAEDAAHIVRDRLDKICAFQGIELADLDLWIITSPSIHLDIQTERLNLAETVEKLKPTLLILDPFVRLHTGIDENLSSAVAPILNSLRKIQTRHHCAVLIVHHARKGAAHIRGGQALRGSSEFHAWGDSNLFLRRKKDLLLLDIEHRNQKGQTAIPLLLLVKEQSLALVRNEMTDNLTGNLATSQDIKDNTSRVLQSLRDAKTPLRIRDIRELCHIRTVTLTEILKQLVSSNKVQKTKDGWSIQHPLPQLQPCTNPNPNQLLFPFPSL